ncbi:MAG: S-layer homology domain-containing protein [Cyanobacteria bacterium P01_A01_bin.123]
MVFTQRFAIGLVALLTLTGCAGGPLGESLQRSLEADSQLEENPPFGQSISTPTAVEGSVAELAEPSRTDTVLEELDQDEPQPSDRDFIGPIYPNDNVPSSPTTSGGSQTFTDLDQAPEELQRYITDLATLGLLKSRSSSSENSSAQTTQDFQPNQAISRREFARWLANTNNRFYRDDQAQKIRLGVASDTSAFQDVPTTDPDFPQIQGLAEAGIIPSALAGNATAVNFRPDAQLTREDLLLWKVPLDVRQNLPDATIQAIEEAWGFQDAEKIDPLALRAVLADYANGDFANIRRVFSFTTLLQPQKAVTRAEAAAALWRFGNSTEGITAQEVAQSNSSSTEAVVD